MVHRSNFWTLWSARNGKPNTPTKARQTGRAFPIPKTEYEPQQPALAIFLVRMTGAFLMFRRIELNVFEAVKQSVTTRQAAERYGIHVGRNGMACCPFHHDKTPSMKLDRRYHCFGCGADGDVIDFAAALYGLGKKEAAVQLAQDFGLSYEDWKPPGKVKKPKPRQKSQEEQFQEAKSRCFRILADYLHLLRAWRKDYAPHSPEEAFHPRFVEALQKQDQVEYLLDVLLFGETEEKAALITDYGKDVIQLEKRMAELAAANAARTKKHHERHAAAPEH